MTEKQVFQGREWLLDYLRDEEKKVFVWNMHNQEILQKRINKLNAQVEELEADIEACHFKCAKLVDKARERQGLRLEVLQEKIDENEAMVNSCLSSVQCIGQ